MKKLRDSFFRFLIFIMTESLLIYLFFEETINFNKINFYAHFILFFYYHYILLYFNK